MGEGSELFPKFIARQQGLPSSQVQDIAIGPHGFPWFAGPSGLVRFAGRRALVYGPEDGLSTQGLRALAGDGSTALWIGHDLGLDRWTPEGGFERWSAERSWSYGFVEVILPSSDGGLWLGTARGLVRVEPGSQAVPEKVHGPFEGELITDIEEGADGEIWAVGPATGLWRRIGEAWQRPASADWQAFSPLHELAITSERTLALGGNGLAEFDVEGRRLAGVDPPWPQRAVTALAFRDGELWTSIGGRLATFARGGEGWVFQRSMGVDDFANAIVTDSALDVWVATEGLGVAKLSGLGSALQRPAQPCPTSVFSIAAGEGDELLIGGSSCSWLARGEELAAEVPLPALTGVQTWDLRRSSDGRLWAATDQGLLGIREGASRPLRTSLVEPARALLARGDEFYVGTIKGLYRERDGVFGELETDDGNGFGYVYTVQADGNDRLWVGTIGNGLWRESDAGRFVRAASAFIPQKANVYSVAFGSQGRWAVSHDRKILVFDRDREEMQTEIVLEATAWVLRFDSRGWLWIGASDGLSAHDPATGRLMQRVGAGIGLSGQEFTTSRSLWVTPRDELVAGGAAGLAVIDGSVLERVPPLPPPVAVRIEGLGAGHGAAEETPRITEGAWTVDVYPAVPWFVDEQSVTFRYRMLGFLDDWQDLPADSASIRFTSLPAGSYTLEVKARAPLVGEGPAAALLSLEVVRPWWWLPTILGVALALAGLGALIPTLRSRALEQRRDELERLVGERTEELARSSEEMARMALEDNLTGLANRRRFMQEMERLSLRAQRTGEDFCLVLNDLDGFKAINDAKGHQAGDAVLRAAAERLQRAARQTDLVCRYGGDEFATLGWDSGGRCDMLAERLRHALAQAPVVLDDGTEVPLRGSFGACTWMDAGCDTKALFRHADRALYKAKEKGNSVVVSKRPEAGLEG